MSAHRFGHPLTNGEIWAAHETGHALACLWQGVGIIYVSIDPRTEIRHQATTPAQRCIICCAGPAAEMLLTGVRFADERDNAFAGDAAILDQAAAELVKVQPWHTVHSLKDAAWRDAFALVKRNWTLLERITAPLLQRHRLEGHEIEALARN